MKQFETPEATSARPPSKWYYCRCGQKLFKIYPNAKAKGILLKCKRCKEIMEIQI